MTDNELLDEAGRLAITAVEEGWGGPFGAVIAQHGRIVAQGQNRVLLSGDPTAHAEIEAIRKAIDVINPFAPTVSGLDRAASTLELVESPDHADLPRARMLSGYSIYTSAYPCPMCLGAIYWACLDACIFGCGLDVAKASGFDDSHIYDELSRPVNERQLLTSQVDSELCAEAFTRWDLSRNRHPY